jgi:hypothetical protein
MAMSMDSHIINKDRAPVSYPPWSWWVMDRRLNCSDRIWRIWSTRSTSRSTGGRAQNTETRGRTELSAGASELDGIYV